MKACIRGLKLGNIKKIKGFRTRKEKSHSRKFRSVHSVQTSPRGILSSNFSNQIDVEREPLIRQQDLSGVRFVRETNF